jgi:hypothetical protein
MAASSALFFKFLLKKNKHACNTRADAPECRTRARSLVVRPSHSVSLRCSTGHSVLTDIYRSGSCPLPLVEPSSANPCVHSVVRHRKHPPPPIHSSKRAIHAPRSAQRSVRLVCDGTSRCFAQSDWVPYGGPTCLSWPINLRRCSRSAVGQGSEYICQIGWGARFTL